MKRKHGQANVEEHPKGSGRHRVRARIDGVLRTLVSGVSAAEAEEAAAAYTATRNEAAVADGVTLKAFGVGFLDRRERAGVRAISGDRSKWGKHVASDPIGELPVASIDRRDVLEWLDGRVGLAHRTRIRLLNLLRVALAEAVDRGLLPANPARDVRVHRSGAARATDDLEGILSPEEQQRLIAAVPERDRAVVVFALCTGLRQAEQWWLKWEDIGADRIVVRRSTGGRPPKGGKPREVFLLPAALAALQSRPVRSSFVWPALRGGRQQEGKAPRGWHRWVKAAGIERRIRWHDLRHTCATALLAGWWGRKWSIDEVCRFMGHSSIGVTERYARKLNETQALAVAATPGPMFPGGNGGGSKPAIAKGETKSFLKPRSQVRLLSGAPTLALVLPRFVRSVGRSSAASSVARIVSGALLQRPRSFTKAQAVSCASLGAALERSELRNATNPDVEGLPATRGVVRAWKRERTQRLGPEHVCVGRTPIRRFLKDGRHASGIPTLWRPDGLPR